jgi:hypothetical protein
VRFRRATILIYERAAEMHAASDVIFLCVKTDAHQVRSDVFTTDEIQGFEKS